MNKLTNKLLQWKKTHIAFHFLKSCIVQDAEETSLRKPLIYRKVNKLDDRDSKRIHADKVLKKASRVKKKIKTFNLINQLISFEQIN